MEESMSAKLSRERWVVSNRDAEVRRGRSTDRASGQPDEQPAVTTSRDPSGPVVAVTGAARGLGHALTTQLARSPRLRRVIAIDCQRGEATGVTWRVVDVRDPALAGRLASVDVVVHTDLDLAPGTDRRARRAFNVRGAQTVLTAAAAGGVGRVVLVTSAMVYGARPDNPVPLPEDAPLGADQDGSVVGDLLEIEQLAQRSALAHPGMAVTVVRPAALVGEGVDTLITRHFEAPRLLTVKGCAPRWQFCHVDDLVSALELAVTAEVTGAFAVGCDGWLEPEQLEELSGLKRIELPAGLTFATAQRLYRAGLTPAPVNDLHFVVYPWVVDCAALRAAGWRPSYDNAAAVSVLLDQRAGHHAVAGRRLDRKDATITAAGATVAVIGTAAIVARARRKRRGT
jgi:nucleoside-diphosphate-sugar epimerase